LPKQWPGAQSQLGLRRRALVQASFDPDPLARQLVGLGRHEHGAEPFDLVQKPVDQAGRIQYRRTGVPQARRYLIDHRVPSISMTSRFDMNAGKREAESKSMVNGEADELDQLHPLQARIAVAADDDVVMPGDPERPCDLDDRFRHLDVRLRRRGIAGGMVVHQSTTPRISLKFPTHIFFPKINWGIDPGSVSHAQS
jgi:hypothetical protein